MLFLNKKTGLEWEISDQEHIKRLLRDSDYELIEKVKEEAVIVEEVKPEPKKEVPKNIKK
ncbi:MAG: hypothetical protein APF81_17700 [Desulfosporosinus sp. BRH_c37]|nr:MAG: hypothetical protein APF81_17700 [Desulfosporosinus sp. BRH_c37]